MADEEQRDEEIQQSRAEESTARPKAVRDAAEQRRIQRQIARCVERAIKSGDERNLAEQLRHAGVVEGSGVWKKVWEIYRASLRPK